MHFILKIGLALFLCWFIALILLWVYQDHFIFFPPESNFEPPEYQQSHLQIQTKNALLNGWYLKKDTTKPTLIFFGGNASNTGYLIEFFDHNLDANILAMQYRGYGRSSGKPSQKALFEDALALYDWLVQKQQVPAQSIFIMGQSLGTGVATYLASQRAVKGVILLTPYASITRLAQQKYPFFPIALLLRHPFNSLQYASQIKAPVMMFFAEQDNMIPRSESILLQQAWNANKQSFIVKDTDHLSIFTVDVFAIIQQFIAK